MGDIASDHEAAIQLVCEEYQRLQGHNPDHELLQYITNVTNQGFDHINDKMAEFLEKFETEEDKKCSYVKVAKLYSAYFVALRDAVDEIEGIDRSPKPPVTKKKTMEELLAELPDRPKEKLPKDFYDQDDEVPF